MAMEQILDFSQELDIDLLDRIVNTMYSSVGQEQSMAQRVLTQLQDHPDAWQRVDQILSKSKNQTTQYLALQILEKTIQTKWKVLPREQCEGIKNFVVGLIVKVSSDETSFRTEKNFLNKLNLTLVQILKQEWPKNWPNFLPEIIASSKQNLTLCENNMAILRYLSEEIFDFSAESMTEAKIKQLKQQMCQEFADIFSLCTEVLQSADRPSLKKATLETLLRFLGWIPLGYIFETDLIQKLPLHFLPNKAFTNTTLKCLSEIGALSTPPEYNERFQRLFHDSMSTLVQLIGQDLQIAADYADASDSDQEFVQNLANFLTGFLGEHLVLVETPELQSALVVAHRYLLQISRIEERELFKVCLEYWTKLVSGLYQEYPTSSDSPLALSNQTQPLRRDRYADVLHQLRIVMIEAMVKPEEVLVVETDEGEVIRERQKETDTIVLYKSMREVLVYLTHLGTEDTEATMASKLARQVDGVEWSWSNLNKLCWAIGSISGAMSELHEKRFLVQIIKDLLGLTEAKRGKDNKAVVASNIMYIVGQYPRFLKAHWKFLKTVINKLFEFMHESHEGVQDMACDTFIKIANKCRRHFVILQSGESRPFIEEILVSMNSTVIDQLSSGQVQVFYEAVGHMIAAENKETQQANLVAKLFEEPNTVWNGIIAMAGNSLDVLSDADNTRRLSQVLKLNNAACTSIGHPFLSQFAKIYLDMLGLYKAVSEIISHTISTEGIIGAKTPRVRNLRIVKKEVLKLVENYISKTEDKQVVMYDCIPPLLEAVLLDYKSNVEQARDSEVLNVMASIINKMGPMMNEYIPGILDSVLDCTLQMISKDFQEYPEHRTGFYALLSSVVKNCFSALLGLPADKFKLVMDSIIWGIKHTMRDIADTSLQTILDLLENVQKLDPQISGGFYQNYLIGLMQDTFYVLTDTTHKSGFKLQCTILAEMFRLVEQDGVRAPLSTNMQGATSNAEFLRNHTMQLLQGAFPHLQPAQIQSFVVQMFAQSRDNERFKTLLKDFLVQLKEFAGEDNAELYIEEKEKEAQTKIKNEYEAAMKVPGLLNPYARPEMDE